MARIGSRDSQKPRRVIGALSNWRNAIFSATDIVGTVAFFSGSSGRPKTLKRSKWSRLGLEVLVADEDLAKLDRTLAGERLHELALTVAGHAGDADDLTGLDLEIETGDGLAALVVFGEETGDLERHAALGGSCARCRRAHDGVSDHHRRHLARRDGADLAAADPRAASQHREVVAERLDLAKLVADHHDGDRIRVRHVAQQAEDLVRLARRQHRGRFVQDEESLVEIEELENFELLLLAGRHG